MQKLLEFEFCGFVPPSKSEWIRALILKSYEPNLRIQIHNDLYQISDDVQNSMRGVDQLFLNQPIEVGESAAAFRFLALRASRIKGTHCLIMKESLSKRPHSELIELLAQLSVKCRIEKNICFIESEGWQLKNDFLTISSNNSSQFASAVFLNAIDLNFTLKVKLEGEVPSFPYLKMTCNILSDIGIKVTRAADSTIKGFNQRKNDFIKIEAKQKIIKKNILIGSDYSSAFVLACLGALFGKAVIKNLPAQTDQADFVFLEILKFMNVNIKRLDSGEIIFKKPETKLKSVSVNLKNAPDLFPVLAVTCAFAEGKSVLFGAPHLVLKESNRIQKISELLSLIKIEHQVIDGGLEVVGSPELLQGVKSDLNMSFDPENDHRIAMAASVLNRIFPGLNILNKNCVNKSFPGFWECIG